MKEGISVIICCYNSSARLYETLKHLAVQQTGAIPWEIILVDNASTDNTAEIAKEIWQQLQRTDVQLRLEYEKRPGLSFARQCGAEAGKFSHLLFCDDDNWLNSDYLLKAFAIITGGSRIGALSGRGIAVSEISFPTWFDEYEPAYAVGKQSDMSGVLNKRGYIWGAGMITPKRLFMQTVNDAYPSQLTDRMGNKLSCGGDSEYCQRLILQGYDIYYDETLIFRHYMPPGRLTETYRTALMDGVRDSQMVLKEYFEANKIKHSQNKTGLVVSAVTEYAKSVVKRRKPNHSLIKPLYYLLNIGFTRRQDLAVIKHFYKSRLK